MPEVSLPFVVLMGIGTVFFGLICIIFLSMAMSAICRSMGDQTPAPPTGAAAPAAPAAQSDAIAEEEGTDLAGIRILSVKKL